MLNPSNRQLYLEALKPPAGYQFDRGIGTTYSLDLLNLLILPLSFVLFDKKDHEDILKEPVEVLEALRRSADKFSVFCQKGQITIPKTQNLLYSYLEENVIEVQPNKDNRVFHPKVWLLRFTAEDEPPIYKFLCLSKNLTFDNSLDVILTLEGKVTEQTHESNKPLRDFILNLPDLSTSDCSPRVTNDIELLSSEIMNIDFEAPGGFHKTVSFHPIGIPGYQGLPIRGDFDRLLVISPFLSDGLLQEISKFNNQFSNILISRLDNLDHLNAEKTLERFDRKYILEVPLIDREEDIEDYIETDESEPNQGDSDEAVDNPEAEAGEIHAKLYLTEKKNYADLWIGSANATNAAFDGNIEFLTRLTGTKESVGIDQILEGGEDKLINMLQDYIPGEEKTDHSLEQELEEKLNYIKNKIIRSRLYMVVRSSYGENVFDMAVYSESGLAIDKAREFSVKIWPLSINESQAQDLSPIIEGNKIVFSDISTEAITSFLAVQISIKREGLQRKLRFVLNIPITGMPENRSEKILQSIISDSNSFIRYLLLLLSEGQEIDPSLRETLEKLGGVNKSSNERALQDIPLVEEMLRALSRDPDKIDRIEKLVKDLSNQEGEEKQIFPEGFKNIWEPIIEARKRMMKDGK